MPVIIFVIKLKEKPAATYFPATAVSSAQESLTSVFGMGTGIASPLWPPALNPESYKGPLVTSWGEHGQWNGNEINQVNIIIWSSLTTY